MGADLGPPGYPYWDLCQFEPCAAVEGMGGGLDPGGEGDVVVQGITQDTPPVVSFPILNAAVATKAVCRL